MQALTFIKSNKWEIIMRDSNRPSLKDVAALAGVSWSRVILLCLGLSGALAGLAGLFEVTGPAGQISIDFNSGYGFTAIIVAFLGLVHHMQMNILLREWNRNTFSVKP